MGCWQLQVGIKHATLVRPVVAAVPDLEAMSRLVYAVEPATQHFFPRHPECPERVEAIQQALDCLGVFRDCAEGQVRLHLPSGWLPPLLPCRCYGTSC